MIDCRTRSFRMSERVTIRKIAAELGLSPATVYRALSGHPNMLRENRQAVLKAARQKGYALPQRKERNIAVIINDFYFSGYLEYLLHFLGDEFHSRGFRLQLISKEDISLLGDQRVDGIISMDFEKGLEKILPKNFAIPILTINSASNAFENIPSIMSDPKGIRKALDYLHDHGCRKIFYLATKNENTLEASERLEEFHRFCLETGQDYENMYLRLSSFEIQENLPKILKTAPDACFCASESYAYKLGICLKAAGVRIPEDISLMGLEYPFYNENFTPPITSIRQNFERIAAVAAENIDGQINKGIPMKGCKIPFTLIERESVRKPDGRITIRGNDSVIAEFRK